MEDAKTDDTNVAEEATEETTEQTTDAPAEEKAAESGEESSSDTGYQFDDDLSDIEAPSAPAAAPAAPSGGGGGGRYADEVFSKTIHAKFRTFYVDVKESSNGKFLKVSEKSRGRKSTVMMDAEDVPAMIEALQEAQGHL